MPSNKCHQETPGRQVRPGDQDSAADAPTEAGNHPPLTPSGTCRLPGSQWDPQRGLCGLPSQLDGHRVGASETPCRRDPPQPRRRGSG